jgi:hypothetical protein
MPSSATVATVAGGFEERVGSGGPGLEFQRSIYPAIAFVTGNCYRYFMTEIEQQILGALVDLEQKVQELPKANPKPNLLPVFARIDELTGQLPRGTAPMLLHYLQKKSYQKARLFLEGRDEENAAGNCRHV